MHSFLDSSRFLRKVQYSYGLINDKVGGRMPKWPTGNSRTGPLAVMPTIEKLKSALQAAEPGDVHFAHLMLPHYPYVFDRNCAVRPKIRDWLNNVPFVSSSFGMPLNSDESRAKRYSRYSEQIECMRSIVKDLLVALEHSGHGRNSIVIIHGDHGSRIKRRGLSTSNQDLLVEDDYRDGYSTFFALRDSTRNPAVLQTPKPLQALLADVWQLEIPAANETHQVYLKQPDSDELLATKLLGFGLEIESPSVAEFSD